MSNVMIALFMAAGIFAWVYSKISHRTGGSITKSLSTAGIMAGLAFMIMLSILWLQNS